MTIGLDFETWSSVNLPERGLDNYVKSPDFRALMASIATNTGVETFDFVFDPDARAKFDDFLMRAEEKFVAHNAPFERAVLNWIDSTFDWRRVVDSAVAARILGAESSLAVASRQLTNSHKLEEGKDLVMLFCVPNDMYPEGPTPELIRKHGHEAKWLLFIEYCEMDARASRDIYLVAEEILKDFDPALLEREELFERATFEMNQAGWHVDVPLVKKMKQRAWANSIIAQRVFLTDTGDQINFNSPAQLKKYCNDRGVPVKSLDKYQLPIMLEKVKKRIAKLDESLDDDPVRIQIRLRKKELSVLQETIAAEWADSHEDAIRDLQDSLKTLEMVPLQRVETARALSRLREVEALLETKLEIGGSTLSKLPRILDLVSEDDILRDQYMHVGAGATFRTTGRGVQMQNIKKLDGNIRDMETVYDLQTAWTNGDMAGQLRQVFNSRHPEGEIIVGDFSAVESRGLAYTAGEEWKLASYRDGKDVYKVLVTKYLGIEYDDVTPELRPRGKYSELSCGYQASAGAVQDFMFRLGFSVSIDDAAKNVIDWRAANPAIINYWQTLDDLLKTAVQGNMVVQKEIGYGMVARVSPFTLPSVTEQHPGALSLCLQLLKADGTPYVTRFVHGCYFIQGKLCYYKPAERDSQGKLWIASYKHPKTGRDTLYSIYGGKFAGIATQSLCREMFFQSLAHLQYLLEDVPNAEIVGQFHDEIGVDWWPGEVSKEQVQAYMDEAMTTVSLPNFPLTVDIKSAHRYIK